MNDNLLEIFKNVNDWLKHAESKNAMLIAFNGVVIFGLIQSYDLNLIKDDQVLTCVLIVSIILQTVSLLIALFSFSPQLRFNNDLDVALKEDKSLIYFEYLSKMPAKYIAKEITGKKYSKIGELDRDLAEQIRQNSKIASIKYTHFRRAVWLTCIVLIIDLIVAIGLLINGIINF
jgi:hypothetical protein